MTRATGRDELHDVLRRVGDLDEDEARERVFEGVDAAALLGQLVAERRAIRLRLGGQERYIAADEAGLYRDALGAAPPGGLPEAFVAPVEDALTQLAARYAAHPRPLHQRRAARALRRRPGSGAAGARARGDARAGRAAARRQRAGVVRRGGPAAPAPGLAGGPAQGDRARRRARARPPSCPPGRGSTAARRAGAGRRPPARGAGAAPGPGAARRELGARRAPPAHRRLLAVVDRRALRQRRAGVGRGRPARAAPGAWRCTSARTRPRSGARRAARLAATAGGSRARARARSPAAAGRASSPTCWSPSTAPPRPCGRRCGTSCGPARRPTTRGRRCGPHG